MEYLQYAKTELVKYQTTKCFKPCYKWNTFNTITVEKAREILAEF